MRHEFECESPADAEERAAVAIRRGIAGFGEMDGSRRDGNAEALLAEFIVDELVEAGFLPAEPMRPSPFQPVI